MASIADLFIRLVADDRGLQAQVTGAAQRAGDAAGTSMGQRLGNGLRRAGGVAVTALGATMAAGLGVGLRGVVELDTAMADFQAETGATRDEVDKASDAVLNLSRSNLAPMAEIAGTMGALRTEMGLTQEQAEDATEAFLHYAEVTGQDGVEAVGAMDDILDAWNLSAGDSQGIMDLLVASHQEYGGSVTDNQDVLARLAPQMQAANLGYEDGIGLLNLFAESGIDASKAPQALTAALSKVESPEELQALIEDIASTEDPFARATMATDLFGARAGPQLAEALAGTTGALTDYVPSAAEAAGATEEAAEAFESSFGRQAQLWFNNIKGLATGLLQDLGPGIGGVAMAASAGAPAFRGLFGLMGSGAKNIIPMLLGGLKLIGPALSLAMGPIGIIIIAVAALFVAWQTNFLGIRDIVGNVVGWLGDHVVPVLKAIFAAIIGFVAGVVSFFTDVVVPVLRGVWDVISSIVKVAIDLVVGYIGFWVGIIRGLIGFFTGTVVPALQGIWNAITSVVRVAVSIVSGIIRGIVTVVGSMVAGVRTLGGVFKGIWDGIASAVRTAVGVITGVISGIAGVVGWVTDVVAGFFRFVTGGAQKAQSEISQVGKNSGGGTVGGQGYQTGAWEIPTNQAAFLHAGEMVVPPTAAQALRDWFGHGITPTPAAAGGDTYNVNLLDRMPATSVRDIGAGLRMLGEQGYLVPKRRRSNGAF